MDTLDVDGSYGEGGGQILRTAVAFSIVTHRPIHVVKIRAGREEPGLRPQHVAALEVLRDVSGGSLEGARVGSSEILFSPGKVPRTSLAVDMKTAASMTLVLQAVVPAISLSGSSLTLSLRGGTDVPWSPTFDYFSTVVREAFRRVGVEFDTAASRRGYYPRGGGGTTSVIRPSEGVMALRLVNAPAGQPVLVVSRCGGLPRHVALRQAESAAHTLRNSGFQVGEITITEEASDSPGSSVLLYEVSEGCLIGTDGIGAKGKPAETVGREAAERFVAQRRSGACIDANLADMIAPVLSLSGEASAVRIPSVTSHLRTSFHVASLFESCDYSFDKAGESTILSVRPRRSHA
jgi:RNA 3'-phosphate cyclase